MKVKVYITKEVIEGLLTEGISFLTKQGLAPNVESGLSLGVDDYEIECEMKSRETIENLISLNIAIAIMDAIQLIKNGQKIHAIKRIRTETRWGLQQAKIYCDDLSLAINGL